LLENLLDKLESLKTDDLFTYSIVVVDNDDQESARTVVESFAGKSRIPVRYNVEPKRSFALVRNKAIDNAQGDFVAFIDDDEYPGNEWLCQLYKALRAYKADGILGPILPHFAAEPPHWIVKSRVCERKSFKTGTIIKNHSHTRTGNVLLDRALFHHEESPFDPRFGKTGGEDTDFFRRMMERGKVFVWCNEAPVWEVVPKERMEKAYFLRRALLRGFTNSKRITVVSMDTFKSLMAVLLYTAAVPFCLVMGQHVFMKYLIKNCDHIGKLLGIFGMSPVEQRSF
jgi:glycosyltransferase involved in cell wall biosynthesis